MLWSFQLLPAEALGPRPTEFELEHIHPASEDPPLAHDVVLIDVRSYAEFMSGHVQGAHSLPLPRLADDVVHLVPDPGQAVVVYCATGARAEQALGLLKRLGYRQAFNGGTPGELAQRLSLPIQAGL